MADGYGIGDIEKKIDEMQSRGIQFSIDQLKDVFQKDFMNGVKEIYERGVKDPNNPQVKEMISVMKDIKSYLESSGATTTQTNKYLSMLAKEVKDRTSRGHMNEERFLWSMNANVSNMGQQSVRAIQSGVGTVFLDPTKSAAQGNALGKTIEKAYMEQLLNKIDSATNLLLAFLAGKYDEKEGKDKKRFNTLAEDIVEGLAKSKFVGGAFMDLVKMFALFTGGFLKQFGPIGKAFAVAVVALAPVLGTVLVNMFSKMLTSVLTNVFTSIFQSKLIGALGNLLKGAGGLLGKGVMGLGRAIFSPQGLAFAAAGGSFVAGISNLRQDDMRSKAAGGLQMAGGIAFALAPFLGPAAPIAVGIGIVADGIALIVKHWNKIMDFFKFIAEKLGFIADDKEEGKKSWWDKIKDAFGGGGSSSSKNVTNGSNVTGTRTFLAPGTDSRGLSESQLKTWDVANTKAAEWSNTGFLMNAGQLTQENAARQTADYLSNPENKKKFDSNYDLIPLDGKYASASDFLTDWIVELQGKKYAVAPKGTRAKLDAMNAQKKDGSRFMMSSGYGLAGRYEGFQPSTHKGPDHFGMKNSAIDLVVRKNGAAQAWTSSDTKIVGDQLGYQNLTVHGDPTGGIYGKHGHVKITSESANAVWNNIGVGSITAAPVKEGHKKLGIEEYDEFAEATQANLAWKKDALERERKKALEDLKIDDQEKRRIDIIKKMVKDAEADVQTVKQADPRLIANTFNQDWTGNLLTGHKLRDTINMAWLQQHQQ